MRAAFRAACRGTLGSLFLFCLFAPMVDASELPTSIEITDEVPSVYVPVELESAGIFHLRFGGGLSCAEFNAGYPALLDAYLIVRDATGAVVAEDDDSDYSDADNCWGAKIHEELPAGSYVVEFTRYGQTYGSGSVAWGESIAGSTTSSTTTLVSSTTTTLPPTTTSSSTTTTSTSTSTTTVLATTTTLPPTTSTSTTTTLPPTTTLAPTTTSSSSTTLPPTTTTSTTTTSTTTTLLPATTSSSTTTSSTTTVAITTSSSSTAVATSSVPPAPAPDAPEAEKELFEEQVNIYSSEEYTEYVPAGSKISVGERRTIVAVTVVVSASPVMMPARRRTR